MNNFVKRIKGYSLKTLVLYASEEIKLVIVNRWLLGSYSQLKEDLILDRLTGFKKKGFYVDIGAYDPYRFSNTMRFYKRGWRGINIEPNTDLWRRFQRARPKDINLNVGIGNKRQALYFYAMNPSTLSTFERQQALRYQAKGFEIVKKTKVQIQPLRDILKKHMGQTTIDFLSIDVEGMELKVLKSNDWKIFRPKWICIEFADYSISRSKAMPGRQVNDYLHEKGYVNSFSNELNTFYHDRYDS